MPRHLEELNELRERSRLLDEVLTSIPVLVVQADAQGRVSRSEGAGPARWGIPEGSLLGVCLLEQYGPDTQLGAAIRQALAGEVVSGVITYPDDSAVEFHVVPRRDAAGRVSGLHGLCLDVSDSHRRHRAERESAAKSRFLAAMSHELRTPLNSILGFNQLLSSESYGPLTERQRRYVDHIERSGSHLLSLLNDALDMAKVSAGSMELDIRPVPVARVCRQVIETMGPVAAGRGVELAYGGDRKHVVQADERRLVQALLNLVGNAIKFTPAGGRVRLSSSAGRKAVAIFVCDTGVGIPAEGLDAIFEEFRQLPEGQGQGGTGLGLPLTRQLVEAMGGCIEVASEVGAGSTFTVRMPSAQAPIGG